MKFWNSSQGKDRLKNPTIRFSFQGVWGLRYFFFLFFPSRSLDYTRAQKGFSVLFFRPPVTKTTCQLTFSLSGGANKSGSTLIYVHWPRLTKRFDSFRSFLRFLTLKMLWGAKRWFFMKNSQKWIFSFWIPSVRREKNDFFHNFSFFRDSRGS